MDIIRAAADGWRPPLARGGRRAWAATLNAITHEIYILSRKFQTARTPMYKSGWKLGPLQCMQFVSVYEGAFYLHENRSFLEHRLRIAYKCRFMDSCGLCCRFISHDSFFGGDKSCEMTLFMVWIVESECKKLGALKKYIL